MLMRNKMDNRYVIMFILLLVLLIFGSFGISFSQQKHDNSKANFDSADTNMYLDDKVVDGVLFSHFHCEYDGNASLFSYQIKNVGQSSIHIQDYEITLYDQSGNYLITLAPYIDMNLASGEEIEMDDVSYVDLSEAKDIKVIVTKKEVD